MTTILIISAVLVLVALGLAAVAAYLLMLAAASRKDEFDMEGEL